MGETITALCYINGTMINGACGIEYSWGPAKAIRITYGITYEELKNKLYRVLHIDRESNKMIITYRYPQVVMPELVKYAHVPITDDEDMEIIFCTIHIYPCLAGVDLFIDVQPLEGSQSISLRDDNPVSSSARRIEGHDNVDTNISEIVLRHAS